MIGRRIAERIGQLHGDAAGHAEPGIATLVPATGAVLLGAGAASGEDVLTIVGAVLLAVGLFIASLVQHVKVEYPVFDRLDTMESKQKSDE
jgi:hypothetical protein